MVTSVYKKTQIDQNETEEKKVQQPFLKTLSYFKEVLKLENHEILYVVVSHNMKIPNMCSQVCHDLILYLYRKPLLRYQNVCGYFKQMCFSLFSSKLLVLLQNL